MASLENNKAAELMDIDEKNKTTNTIIDLSNTICYDLASNPNKISILSWNVAGIRARIRKGGSDFLTNEDFLNM